MSSKSNKSKTLTRHCPYKHHEVKKAAALLKREVERGSLGFLQRKFTFAGAGLCDNVWEGSEGYMEHVKGSFPMPEKMNEGECSKDCDSQEHGQSSSSSSKLTGAKKKKKDKFKISQPSSSSAPLKSSNEDFTVVDLVDDDCVIVEQDKVVIDIEDDDDKHSSVIGNDEFVHWQILFKLHEEITQAKQRLEKIEIIFESDQTPVKACADINFLRGHIILLINKLRQAKNNIDNRNFSETLSPKTKKIYFEKNTLHNKDASYKSIWILFKSLCNDFVSVRERWKDVLVEHRGFQNSSPSELQSSIQSIKFNVKT